MRLKIIIVFIALMLSTNAISAVLLEDNFDSGYTTNTHANMSTLSSEFQAKGWNGIWWDNSSYVEVSTTRSHSGSQSVKHYFSGDQDRATLYGDSLNNTDILYVSYWVYLESDYWVGWSSSGGEQKWGRFFYTNDHSASYPISQHMYGNGRDGCSGACMEWELNANSTKYLALDYDFSANRGKWLRLEYLYIMNTAGSSNGTLIFWVDGVKQNIYLSGSSTPMADNAFVYRTSNDNHFNSFWLLSLNNGTPSPAQTAYLDDVYVSNTNDHINNNSVQSVTGGTISGGTIR